MIQEEEGGRGSRRRSVRKAWDWGLTSKMASPVLGSSIDGTRPLGLIDS